MASKTIIIKHDFKNVFVSILDIFKGSCKIEITNNDNGRVASAYSLQEILSLECKAGTNITITCKCSDEKEDIVMNDLMSIFMLLDQ